MSKCKINIKNPYFWIGIMGVIMTAIDADIDTLTSWSILIDRIKEIFSNPYMIINVVMAVIGVLCNPEK